MNELDGSEEEEIVTVVLEEAKEKWDCESVSSKYSNNSKNVTLVLHWDLHMIVIRQHRPFEQM